jgi:hypothetical protein
MYWIERTFQAGETAKGYARNPLLFPVNVSIEPASRRFVHGIDHTVGSTVGCAAPESDRGCCSPRIQD